MTNQKKFIKIKETMRYNNRVIAEKLEISNSFVEKVIQGTREATDELLKEFVKVATKDADRTAKAIRNLR